MDSTLEANNSWLNTATDNLCTSLESYNSQLSELISKFSVSKPFRCDMDSSGVHWEMSWAVLQYFMLSTWISHPMLIRIGYFLFINKSTKSKDSKNFMVCNLCLVLRDWINQPKMVLKQENYTFGTAMICRYIIKEILIF